MSSFFPIPGNATFQPGSSMNNEMSTGVDIRPKPSFFQPGSSMKSEMSSPVIKTRINDLVTSLRFPPASLGRVRVRATSNCIAGCNSPLLLTPSRKRRGKPTFGEVIRIDVHKRIAVAMSGGVDSAVAALLLCEAGHDVEGVTMLLGLSASGDDGLKRLDHRDVHDAKRICQKLGIGHRVVDFKREMEKEVIEPFIAEYLRGQTPNPCVTCNRRLKFGLLLEKVLSWGFEGLATGHYAALESANGSCRLKKPKDSRKDQTYFLYSLPKERLPLLAFPLAGYTKEEVRALAVGARLPLSDKKESQDVCFIPRGGYQEFLRGRRAKMDEGQIVDREGRVLGQHRGIGCYTIGQRGGMGISSPAPLYVIGIDAAHNRLIAGRRDDLKAGGLIAGAVNWLVEAVPEEARAKIRYGHRAAKCRILPRANGCVIVRFAEEQQAISPGQSIVFYDDSTVLGGGVIKEVLRGNI